MVQAVNGGSGWGAEIYLEQARRTAERRQVQEQILEKVRRLSPNLSQPTADSGTQRPDKGGLLDVFI